MARKSRKQERVAADNGACGRETWDKTWRVGAYLRLSCDDTKKRGDSLETQRNIIENYTMEQPDMQLIAVYSDNNATGTNFDRPGFQQMMTDAQQGGINCIIVKDLTRFGRNAIDSGYYLEKVLPAMGIRFIAVTDSYDSNDPQSGFLLPFKNIISESYALDIGRKVRAVQHQNIHEGRFVGRLAPYGYQKDPDDCHRLIPDPETAPIVRQMFEWAMQGETPGDIARQLNDAGIPTPGQRNHAKGLSTSEKLVGNPYWKLRKIKYILSDRMYLGEMVQGKTVKVRGKQIANDPSEWVCIPNTHEPLISREVFEQVQSLRDSVREKAAAIKKTPYTPHIFQGKVFCAHCGFLMHRNKQINHDYYWFRCESQWKYGKDTCVQVSVKESAIQDAVLVWLGQNAGALRYAAHESLMGKTDADSIEAELQEIRRALGNAGRYSKSLYENLVNAVITPDEYTLMKTDYEAKIAALIERADTLRHEQRKNLSRQAESLHLAGVVSQTLRCGQLTKELIDCLIERIDVRQDKTFSIVFRGCDSIKGVAG